MARNRLHGLDDLERFRAELRAAEKQYRARVLICMTACRSLGAIQLHKAFCEKVAAADLQDEVAVVSVGCHGQCALAPAVLIEPEDFLYGGVQPDDVDEIIETTLRQGKPVARLCQTVEGKAVATPADAPFYGGQSRRVLADCGRMDPARIEDALARGNYAAMAKVLTSMRPEEVIEEVRASGLRGRSGGGFPTGVKWGLCRQASGEEKFLICNANEGDPGAFKDRAILEGLPHQVIEGMVISAYAIGASHGFVHLRADYPIAIEHMTTGLAQARESGLLGENILGTGFSFDVEIRTSPGEFVCGEEGALIASLEGKRGMPRPRPPFPVQKGYLGKPTCINNVETFANVPLIILRGKDWYRGFGIESSPGTKVFALAGRVNNTGLVEVPMDTTLRQIIFDIGGGIPQNRRFMAVQFDGPSGGCLPAQYLDLPIDYDSVKQAGTIMGSSLVVMDETTCMVDIARYFLEFIHRESCGQCVPCRVGTRHMLDILDRICAGQGHMEDLDKLERLGTHIEESSFCGLGQTAPSTALTTLRYFRHEYEEHIQQKHCRAGVCEALVTAGNRSRCDAEKLPWEAT